MPVTRHSTVKIINNNSGHLLQISVLKQYPGHEAGVLFYEAVKYNRLVHVLCFGYT